MSKKTIKSVTNSKFVKTLTASLMAASVFVPVASSVSADENKTTCTLTIYASKHADSKADATGACKDEIYGYYVPDVKLFKANGMYAGDVKNGQKEEIALSGGKYSTAMVTFYTVNDLDSKPTDTKPPKDVKPSKPKTSNFVSFKGLTNKTTTVWSGTSSKSKKIGKLNRQSLVTLTSEKASRYSITYKKKKRWINKSDVDTAMREFKVKTTTDKLNVRTGMSTKYQVITQLKKGFVMYGSLSPKKDWLKVEYAPLKYGYVATKYTKKLVEFKKFSVKTKEILNVRDGRSTKEKIVGKLKKGSTVTVIGSKDGWYTISYKGKTSYISSKYTTKNSNTKKK